MTSEIDKLKHFHAENYSDTNFTDDLNNGEEFLYTTIRIKDDKEVTFLCKLYSPWRMMCISSSTGSQHC